LGTSALVGAFYAGGRVAARTPAALDANVPAAAVAVPVDDIGGGPVDAVAPVTRRVTRVSAPARVISSPATIDDEPLEVYRPRVVRTSYPPAVSSPTRLPDVASRPDAPPARSWQRSAIIIGSSAAVAATVGGLAKGKKGVLIGGIVGGGAATVWDQMTRRKNVGDR
jgi:hypothetical protein